MRGAQPHGLWMCVAEPLNTVGRIHIGLKDLKEYILQTKTSLSMNMWWGNASSCIVATAEKIGQNLLKKTILESSLNESGETSAFGLLP